MIEPLLKDDAFLADVRSARQEPGLHIWWVGQSGFLVQHDGAHLLFDPYLSDSLTDKYTGTTTPHERMTERVIAPERLTFVDVVTSSHRHTDHLDGDTFPHILSGGARLICAAGSETLAEERAGRPPSAALAPGDRYASAGFDIVAVPADHEGAPEAVGYVVKAGSFALYHSGDTVRREHISQAVQQFNVDVAFLPINGQLGNMSGPDAANVASEIGAKLAVPCHFEMFRFNTASPKAFMATCQAINQPYRVMRSGDRLRLES